ncbi:phosphonate C-P lyase system protein PhnH [uncultured Metabacillus sp.]|uniref:phosphonate C-P lyase system protein PhnH n=1 Tax=uncultured Metabacillus sp. TaxID=2860135 RepID=UPI0026092651|nr:phosphonate C-P lyase system protein PhnH [uncultured Metabacillus sp.]
MQKANLAAFDMVHDTQRIFRKLLDCMARPGKIEKIAEEITTNQEMEGFSKSLQGIAYTLIDREVSFHILAEHSEIITRSLEWKTYSKGSPINAADYLFINHPEEVDNISECIQQLKNGTLSDPHDSATVVLCVDEITVSKVPSSLKLTMRGPGIETSNVVYIKGLPSKWIEERNLATSEFPLGIDFILTTNCGDIMALPRTTLVESEGL